MSTNKPSFRYPWTLTEEQAHPAVHQALRVTYQGVLDLNQAISALTDKVNANTKAVAAVAGAPATTTPIPPISALAASPSAATATVNVSVNQQLLANTSAGGFTANLPTAGVAGQAVRLKKTSTDGNTLTITPSGTDTIDGNPSSSIVAAGGTMLLISDGRGNWNIS